MKKFDVVVLGAGPGGYVAAIRASQLGKKVAIIEKEHLGGVCLNKGCIPTKALLKSAHSVHELKNLKNLGINVELKSLDGGQAVKRAKSVSERVAKGIAFLLKNNKVEVLMGVGKLLSTTAISVTNSNNEVEAVGADQIIISTGAHYKSFPGLEHDGDRLIGAWEAIKMEQMPESIAIIGAGAIGVEFAYFYNAFGVKTHIFELLPHLLPLEDEDSSKEIERSYRRYGIKTSLGISSVSATNNGNDVTITSEKNGQTSQLNFDKCLIATGMTGNIEGIGLESIGVAVEKGFIKVDDKYQTNIPNIYAIGDVSGPPLLAHVASHEGIIAASVIGGITPHPIDKKNIAGCTYCQPQVASIGYTEKQLQTEGIKYTVGKMPFMSNGKALASNEKDGFSKVLLSTEKKLLGAHIVGNLATELIHEFALLQSMNGTAEQLINTIHPHPTLGEWLAEATMAANGKSIHG
ncbi:MAG: dihydrolipoyl dehydrogenase [Bacteriovoracaceae bacterium]|nr:dihydrolipoyl dehydrogenase [Bacteriovoracaceae bacterium]